MKRLRQRFRTPSAARGKTRAKSRVARTQGTDHTGRAARKACRSQTLPPDTLPPKTLRPNTLPPKTLRPRRRHLRHFCGVTACRFQLHSGRNQLLLTLLCFWLAWGFPQAAGAQATPEPPSQTPSQTSPPTSASDSRYPNERVLVGDEGIDAYFPEIHLQGHNSPTFYEMYPTSSYEIPNTLGTWKPEDLTGRPLNNVAEMIFQLSVWLNAMALRVMTFAFTTDLWDTFGAIWAYALNSLRVALFDTWVMSAVLLAGVWVAWHGLWQRRAVNAAQGAIWTVIALSVASLWLAAPYRIIHAANTLTTEVAGSTLTTLSHIDVARNSDPPIRYHTTAAPTFEGAQAEQELRLAAERWWYVYVYEPWLHAVFGSYQAGKKYGEELLQAQTVRHLSEKSVLDPMSATKVTNLNFDLADINTHSYKERMEGLQDKVHDDRGIAWDTYQGHRPSHRLSTSAWSLFSSVLGSLSIFIVSGLVLVAQCAIMLLVIFSPIPLLLGINPAWRNKTLQWASFLLNAFIKRILYTLALSVVIVFQSMATHHVANLGWLLVVQLAFYAALWMWREPLFDLASIKFTNVDNGKINIADQRIGRAAQQGGRALGRVVGWTGHKAGHTIARTSRRTVKGPQSNPANGRQKVAHALQPNTKPTRRPREAPGNSAKVRNILSPRQENPAPTPAPSHLPKWSSVTSLPENRPKPQEKRNPKIPAG